MPSDESQSSEPEESPWRWRFTLRDVFAAMNLASLVASAPKLLVVAGIVAFWTLGGAFLIFALALLQLPLYWAALALRPAVADESRL